ncbi:nuclear speckle splicing regulatory protein 1-like isoform X2 [Petromyzon marinus]|uniref:nuclear speckle splicing regulatory protein 1-like isoform X2 n=1 Tax=Petromyzon marinus TaxID=7757 RepID=UPI003F72C79F
MAAFNKGYGLILSNKKKTTTSTTLLPLRSLPKPSVFNDDSDEDTVGDVLQREADKKKTMKQTTLQMQRVLDQDSSVYEYDEVYDDMKRRRDEEGRGRGGAPAGGSGGAPRESRYVALLQAACHTQSHTLCVTVCVCDSVCVTV